MHFDQVYRARYEILEVVAGTPASREVTFTVADHFGDPEFAHYASALLFLGHDDEGWYLHKYKAFPVQRTNDGDWATCGLPNTRPALVPEPISFAQDLGGPYGERLPGEQADDYWLEATISSHTSRHRRATAFAASKGAPEAFVRNGAGAGRSARVKAAFTHPDALGVYRRFPSPRARSSAMNRLLSIAG